MPTRAGTRRRAAPGATTADSQQPEDQGVQPQSGGAAAVAAAGAGGEATPARKRKRAVDLEEIARATSTKRKIIIQAGDKAVEEGQDPDAFEASIKFHLFQEGTPAGKHTNAAVLQQKRRVKAKAAEKREEFVTKPSNADKHRPSKKSRLGTAAPVDPASRPAAGLRSDAKRR